jgi:pheromone shutdown-related protein TraB
MDSVVELEAGGKKVWIVGTAHVSEKSVKLVEETIKRVRPDAVAVELCKQRRGAILNEKKWEETEISEVVQSGRSHLFMAQILLANYQRRIGDKLGVAAGAEMKAALKAAEGVGAAVELVDRDIKTTLRRAAARLSFGEKFRILSDVVYGIMEGEEVDEKLVEKLKEKDILSEFIEELSKDAPSIKEVLIDERDAYIAGRIAGIRAEKIVAVVGAGHVDGIKKLLEKRDLKTDFKKLETVTEKKSWTRHLTYVIPALFVVILALGFGKGGGKATWDMLASWFVISGGLAAVGAALALGHPLTILTALVAAPFTVLHPAIAVGWVAALVELKVRKPRVLDFKNLMKLNGVWDYWRNRVTRTLLVMVFSNIGASIGTFFALSRMASLI